MMTARLLVAVAESEVESGLSGDLARARRLATILGESPETIAALSRTLIELPPSLETVPHIHVQLARWAVMRAQLLIGVVDHAGSVRSAHQLLDVPHQRLRRQVRRARSLLHRARRSS